MAEPTLFDVSGDDLLISVFRRQGRTLDDLPYTAEFESLYAAVGDVMGARGAVFHRLHNLRKAGRLPRMGRAASAPPRIAPAQEAVLVTLVERAVGALSRRDQLVYAPAFDELVAAFNSEAGLNLSAHDVWRIVAKLAK